MTDLNKVMVLGNIGRDPDIRYTANGSATCEFTVAANRNYRRGDQWEKQTEWFTVVAWNKLAEMVSQNLSKGDRVYVEGRLQTRSWDDQSGTKRYKTEVIADRVLPQSKGNKAQAAPEAPADSGGFTDPDDLPFE